MIAHVPIVEARFGMAIAALAALIVQAKLRRETGDNRHNTQIKKV